MENESLNKLIFVVLGGWGVRSFGEDNAFSDAKDNYFKELLSNYPATTLLVEGNSRKERFEAIAGQPAFTKIISENNGRQFFLAETERSAYIFETMRGASDAGVNDRFLIVPSMTESYEDKPSGKIKEIESEAVKVIKTNIHDFITVDLSTVDLMLENKAFKSVPKTIGRVDEALRKICETGLDNDYIVVISSYGGNAEKMRDMSLDMDDSNLTNSPVPLVIVGKDFYGRSLGADDVRDGDLSALSPAGSLKDIGPTILDLMNIGQPKECEGESLAGKLI